MSFNIKVQGNVKFKITRLQVIRRLKLDLAAMGNYLMLSSHCNELGKEAKIMAMKSAICKLLFLRIIWFWFDPQKRKQHAKFVLKKIFSYSFFFNQTSSVKQNKTKQKGKAFPPPPWPRTITVLLWFLIVVSSLSRVWLCDPMDCNPPGSSVRGISKTRILEWVAISLSKGSSQPRDQTSVSYIASGLFTTEPPSVYWGC